jgi:hypothetical protein
LIVLNSQLIKVLWQFNCIMELCLPKVKIFDHNQSLTNDSNLQSSSLSNDCDLGSLLNKILTKASNIMSLFFAKLLWFHFTSLIDIFVHIYDRHKLEFDNFEINDKNW